MRSCSNPFFFKFSNPETSKIPIERNCAFENDIARSATPVMIDDNDDDNNQQSPLVSIKKPGPMRPMMRPRAFR